MRRPSRETLFEATGYGLAAIGLGIFAVTATNPDLPETLARIRAREDAIAATIGRPPTLEIARARSVLIPAVTYPKTEEYFGDADHCAPSERRFRMVDAACGVLDLAREKEKEFRAALALDDILNELKSEVEEQRSLQNKKLLEETGLLWVGFLMVLAASEATRRRKLQLNLS